MNIHVIYVKYFFSMIFLFPCDLTASTPLSSMYNDKLSFRKESVLLYERYKRNKDPCHTEVMELLEKKCSHMNPSTKIMAAAHLMNCQYTSAGRATHWFNESCSSKDECLDKLDNYFKDLGSDNYNVEMIALYFTHVDIICYYMNRVDYNKRHFAQLEQISTLSEEIWNQLGQVKRQNYELLEKQNNSKNVVYALSSITLNSYNFIKNASNQLLVTFSNMNISARNSKILLMDSVGVVYDVFYRLEQLIRAALWNMHKFGGILFFTVISLYVLFLTNITNTKYTRTKLMILLWLLFMIDASMVFFVIQNQPLKHLSKYVAIVRSFCVIIINLIWALLSYYIPRWIPVSNVDISYLVDTSRRSRGNDSYNLKKSFRAVSNIRKAQNRTISVLKEARKRGNNHNLIIDSNDIFDDQQFVTGMEQLPKPLPSALSAESENGSLLSASAKYFHNVVDSINLVSPARRWFGSLRPNFATSTVIRESTNRKPLSPQILKRSTSSAGASMEGTLNASSPFTFKIPIKNAFPTDSNDHKPNLYSSTTASFYGSKVIPPTKPQSNLEEKITSSTKNELKRKNSGRRNSPKKAPKNEFTTDSDLTTEDSSEAVKRKRGRKPAASSNKRKSRIPTAKVNYDNVETKASGRKYSLRSKQPPTEN